MTFRETDCIMTFNTVDKCPCMKCNNRSINCHSICKSYKKWKSKYEQEKEKYRKYKEQYLIIRKGDFLGDDGLMSNSKLRGVKKQRKKRI